MTIPVYVLTLADAAERRQPLVDALDGLAIPFTLWHGVDGRHGLPAEHEHLIDRAAARKSQRREMGDGEFACALSHHFIYRDIVEKGIDRALVLEDDVEVGPALRTILDQAQRHDYDLLLLDHSKARILPDQSLDYADGVVAYRVFEHPYLTSSYIITQQGAAALLAKSLPISAPADWPYDISLLRTYACDPIIVRQAKIAASYLDTERTNLPTTRVRPPSRRFFTSLYWRRKFRKRSTRKIS